MKILGKILKNCRSRRVLSEGDWSKNTNRADAQGRSNLCEWSEQVYVLFVSKVVRSATELAGGRDLVAQPPARSRGRAAGVG